MKKVKRIFFVFYTVGLFCFGAYTLRNFIFSGYFWERVAKDPTYLIPLGWMILSLPSLFFNLEKLGESAKKSKIYKFTRIGDLIFSICMIPLILLGLISLTYLILNDEVNPRSPNQIYWPISIMIGCLIAHILLFIDNIKYHKSFRNRLLEKETIDDIGKGA